MKLCFITTSIAWDPKMPSLGEKLFQSILKIKFKVDNFAMSRFLSGFSNIIVQASCFPLQSLISDYEDALQRLQDPDINRQLSLVVDALRLSSSLLRYSFFKK